MTQEVWDAVDRLVESTLLGDDPMLDAALTASQEAGLPQIAVSPAQGALLSLLVRVSRARAVLEVGTLGGYSTIWMARALPPGGRLVTVELNPDHAAVARKNLDRAGLGDLVEVQVGDALPMLRSLVDAGQRFDLVFLDADKPGNPAYFAEALRLTDPGGLIIVDNVVRRGAVADQGNQDPAVVASRRLFEQVGGTPDVRATVVQTVGVKGHDGLLVAVVGDRDGSR